jgi:phosphatidylglycerol:prolipoprotein diacylglycerol transferase
MLSFLAYITWTASPIIAKLGPLTLRWYGLLFMSGFVIGTFVLTHIYKAERVSPRWVDVITVYMLVGTVVGARLGHCLFYDPDYYLAHPLDILKIWEGGLASHGATLGILLAVWLFSRNNKFDYLWTLDRIVIVVASGGAMIRLGNLFNSEIIGRQTDVPWAFKFARYNEIHHELTNIPNELRHPTQIYESLFCVFLFILLYAMWNRTKERTPRGLLFGLFVVLLFTFRVLVEFLKENQVDFENRLPLNMGQILSIPLIFVGIWVVLKAGKWPGNPFGYAPRDLGEETPDKSAVKVK